MHSSWQQRDNAGCRSAAPCAYLTTLVEPVHGATLTHSASRTPCLYSRAATQRRGVAWTQPPSTCHPTCMYRLLDVLFQPRLTPPPPPSPPARYPEVKRLTQRHCCSLPSYRGAKRNSRGVIPQPVELTYWLRLCSRHHLSMRRAPATYWLRLSAFFLTSAFQRHVSTPPHYNTTYTSAYL